jgi:hypothetical protein
VQSNDNGIVCKEQTPQRDMKAFESISVIENASVYHPWWEPQPNQDDCMLHFAEECNNDGVLMVMELLFPTLKQKAMSKSNGEVLWRKYLRRVKMNANVIRNWASNGQFRDDCNNNDQPKE